MSDSRKNHRRWAFSLATVQVFIGLSAVAGGVGLVSEPSGGNLGMSVDWLSESPFADYFIPGLVLLSVIGVGNLIGGGLSFFGRGRAGEIAVALGAFLAMWILAQLWWIGLEHWLQPLFFGLGVLELALGVGLRALCARS